MKKLLVAAFVLAVILMGCASMNSNNIQPQTSLIIDGQTIYKGMTIDKVSSILRPPDHIREASDNSSGANTTLRVVGGEKEWDKIQNTASWYYFVDQPNGQKWTYVIIFTYGKVDQLSIADSILPTQH